MDGDRQIEVNVNHGIQLVGIWVFTVQLLQLFYMFEEPYKNARETNQKE